MYDSYCIQVAAQVVVARTQSQWEQGRLKPSPIIDGTCCVGPPSHFQKRPLEQL
jgi:hypothetical protein